MRHHVGWHASPRLAEAAGPVHLSLGSRRRRAYRCTHTLWQVDVADAPLVKLDSGLEYRESKIGGPHAIGATVKSVFKKAWADQDSESSSGIESIGGTRANMKSESVFENEVGGTQAKSQSKSGIEGGKSGGGGDSAMGGGGTPAGPCAASSGGDEDEVAAEDETDEPEVSYAAAAGRGKGGDNGGGKGKGKGRATDTCNLWNK